MLTKNLFASLWLVLAILLVGQSTLRAQGNYTAPKRLWLKGDDTKEPETFDPSFLLRAAFYPIGWSKDGKFAYLVEPADEACGCYFAELVIQDLRTDKVLWEKKYEGAEGKEENLRSFWRKYQKEISRQLAKHGIVAQTRFALQNPAFKYQKDTLTPELKVNTTMDDEQMITGNVVLELVSKDKGRKTIYEQKFEKEFGAFLDAELAGSLLSPFEPRAVVVMVETYRGYEGPPNITGIRIVGASLKAFR
jgi:hypothetical protein